MSETAKALTPFCPPGATFYQAAGGESLCIVPPTSCKPGQVQICTDSFRCTCVAGDQVRLCTASIAYPAGQPAAAWLVPMEPHCDGAGAELAIAVILARLLGQPR